jgi:hypothetical protein
VDRNGLIVALCAGPRPTGAEGIPIAPVREALELLEQRLAR